MGYLASAYGITWLLIAAYMLFLGKKTKWYSKRNYVP